MIRRTSRLVAGVFACLAATTLGIASAAACDTSDKIEGAGERYFILAEGDSITFGAGATDGKGSYAPRACVPQVSGIELKVAAISGAWLGSPSERAGVNSLYGRMISDNAILATRKGKRIAILTILIGRNDLLHYSGGPDEYADHLAQYVQTMRRSGWDKVIVGTLLPSVLQGFDLQRNDLNSILTMPGWARAHGIDGIAQFATAPVIGPDAAANDRGLFADGTHPTNAGYALMVPAYDAALKAVIKGSR